MENRHLRERLASLAAGLLTVAAGLVIPSREAAADPPEPAAGASREQGAKKAPEPVDVVVTGTRAPGSARRSPVRVDVVTRSEAERRGATNVGEALAWSLGTQVNPSSYTSIGQPSAIQIGGLDRDRVLVVEDGERVIGDTGGAIDLAQIPLSGVSRVETMQGPASALYGASALGGVVSVVTEPPEIEGPSGRARLEYRSPEGVFATGSAALRRGGEWAELDGSLARASGIALDPSLPDLALPGVLRGFVGLRAGTALSPRLALSARVRFTREAEQGLETQTVPGLGRYVTDLPALSDRLSARLRQTLSLEGGHRIDVSLGKQWFWGTTSKDRRDSPVDEVRRRAHTMHSAEVIASLFPGRAWSGLVGARLEAETFSQELRKTEVASGALGTSTFAEVPETSLVAGALYGQLRVEIGEQWSLTAGGRLEGSSRYGVAGAPSLGVAFTPSSWLLLRVHSGRGYRAPSAKELGFAFDHSVYGYRVIGNPDLAPETSWGVGGDVEVTPARGVRLRGSCTASWVEQMIDLALSNERVGGVDTYQYRNVGAARTAGVSVDLSVKAASWLRAEVGWAYTFTRDEEAARPLPGRPPHTVTASVIGSLPYGVEALARARFVTDAYLEDDLRAPGFWTLDARVQKEIRAGLRVFVGGLNLLGAQKDPRRAGDARPLEGRVFHAGASADFPWES